jgi:uncharacterized membrane protein
MTVEWVKPLQGAPETPGAPCASGSAPRWEAGDPPALHLRLSPNRSLTPQGFVWVIGCAAGLALIPLLGMLGTVALWGVLPFFVLVIWAIWAAIRRHWRDTGQVSEELSLWSDRIELIRQDPRGGRRDWSANPYWVSLHLRPEGGPVDNYLTLKGGGREVELGAFLSPQERESLHSDLQGALAAR